MNRIKELLEIKGATQTDLANQLGKSFNMINLYASIKYNYQFLYYIKL